jgi:hypothetical protein
MELNCERKKLTCIYFNVPVLPTETEKVVPDPEPDSHPAPIIWIRNILLTVMHDLLKGVLSNYLLSANIYVHTLFVQASFFCHFTATERHSILFLYYTVTTLPELVITELILKILYWIYEIAIHSCTFIFGFYPLI